MKKILITLILLVTLTGCGGDLTEYFKTPFSEGVWCGVNEEEYKFSSYEDYEIETYIIREVQFELKEITLAEYKQKKGVNAIWNKNNQKTYSLILKMKINDDEEFVQYDMLDYAMLYVRTTGMEATLGADKYDIRINLYNDKYGLDIDIRAYLDANYLNEHRYLGFSMEEKFVNEETKQMVYIGGTAELRLEDTITHVEP